MSTKAAPQENLSDLDVESGQVALGARVREARRGRYSIDELAMRSGLSTGIISMLERGQSNPSLATLMKLASALDLPLESFFSSVHTPRVKQVVRANERMRLVVPQHGADLNYEVLTPSLRANLGFLRVVIPPHSSTRSTPLQHIGEESVHVLSGRVRHWVDDEEFLLEPGDTLTYDASLRHCWENLFPEPAVVFGVMTPPIG